MCSSWSNKGLLVNSWVFREVGGGSCLRYRILEVVVRADCSLQSMAK